MSGLREVRDALLHSYAEQLINEEEFLLLYDLNKSKNPDYAYWNYERFDIDRFNDDECMAEFRFLKNDIHFLCEKLEIPEVVTFSNRLKVTGVESLCILLNRFAYPSRLGDRVHMYGRPVPQLSMIINEMTNTLYDAWLSPRRLDEFAQTVHRAGAPLTNCWGFVDGTVRPICRPGEFQRIVFNGHHRVHAIKFQSIATPNGLVANLYGPVEGRRHDSGMLRDSEIYAQLEQFSHAINGDLLCIYGDLAYPFRPHLQTPFRNVRRTPDQNAYNTAMSKVRIGVEWVFGDIVNFYKFLDFKKNLKLGLQCIGKMYIVCTFLMNIRTCMYGSMTSSYFNLDPPSVDEYLE